MAFWTAASSVDAMADKMVGTTVYRMAGTLAFSSDILLAALMVDSLVAVMVYSAVVVWDALMAGAMEFLFAETMA